MAQYVGSDKQPGDRHFRRLTECVEATRRHTERYRTLNRKLINHSMGQQYPRWGDDAPEIPLNLGWISHRAMSRFLYMREPRGLATTQINAQKSFAEDAQIALNRTIRSGDVGATLGEVVDQALYTLGALFTSADYVSTPKGMQMKLVTESVPFPDQIWDAGASDPQKSDYRGRIIEMRKIDVMSHPLFDEEARNKVESQPWSFDGSGRDSNWNRPATRNRTDLYDYCRLCQVYDAPANRLYVWPEKQPDLKLLDREWSGPRIGPIRFLHFGRPPGHAFPVSPMMNVHRLANAANVLLAKALQQQQASKGLLLYTSASREEADRVVHSTDLESALQEHGSLRWTHIGGASPDTVSMFELARKMFSYSVGNLDQLLGIGNQAPTLGQERMLAENTTANMQELGEIVFLFIKEFINDAYWFNVRDPHTRETMTKRMGNTGLTYDVGWTPEKRRMIQGMEFDVSVEPYSYRNRTPDGRLADFLGSLQLLSQWRPEMAAQGMMFNVEAIMRNIASLRDLPEMYDAVILNQSPDRLTQLLGSNEGKTPMEAMSGPNGRYIRESRGDGSGEMMEILRSFGRGNADQEVAAA